MTNEREKALKKFIDRETALTDYPAVITTADRALEKGFLAGYAARDAELQRLRDALSEIEEWAKAYLSAYLSLTISGSNMRHVITRVGKIASKALAEADQKEGE